MGSTRDTVQRFQSPKTGLCYFHQNQENRHNSLFIMFQSPKTGLCYFHFNNEKSVCDRKNCFNPLKRVYAIFTNPNFSTKGEVTGKFQSPKTGLCYFHFLDRMSAGCGQKDCFNPLKRVYAIFTVSGEISDRKVDVENVSIP